MDKSVHRWQTGMSAPPEDSTLVLREESKQEKAPRGLLAGLLVFYSNNIESTLAKVVGAGGKVLKPIFNFPGGRRFHFVEPSGNEFAVWSEAGA